MSDRDTGLEMIRSIWQSALSLAQATTLARGNPVGTRHGMVADGCIAVENAIKVKLAEIDRELAAR